MNTSWVCSILQFLKFFWVVCRVSSYDYFMGMGVRGWIWEVMVSGEEEVDRRSIGGEVIRHDMTRFQLIKDMILLDGRL